MPSDYAVWQKETYVSAALSASCCNCVGLIFAFLMAISPYYLWVTGYIAAPASLTRTTLATGSFVLSATSTRIDFPGVIVVNGQTNYWTDMTSAAACDASSEVYTMWAGKYGFCDAANGTFSIPTDVVVVQAFSIMTIIFLCLTVISGCLAEPAGVPALLFAALTSFLAMICAIVSFSTIAANPWNQDLLQGVGTMPFRQVTGDWALLKGVRLFYGPSFGGSIFVFIVSFFATIILFQASHWVSTTSKDDTADDFVDEAPDGATGEPETKPGDEGQMYKA